MPKGPAARVGDPTVHGPPLSGAGSPNVRIGGLPAWRGVGVAGVPALQASKSAADARIQAAEAATFAAVGTPGLPGAKASEQAVKTSTAAAMAAQVAACAGAGGDLHSCPVLLPPVPHGPGVVIDGSATVRINGLPACRQGDTLVEAVGPPNRVAAGAPRVTIGG